MSEQKYLISRIFKYFDWSLMLSVSVITLNVSVLAEKYHIIYLSTLILSIVAILGTKLQGYGEVY